MVNIEGIECSLRYVFCGIECSLSCTTELAEFSVPETQIAVDPSASLSSPAAGHLFNIPFHQISERTIQIMLSLLHSRIDMPIDSGGNCGGAVA